MNAKFMNIFEHGWHFFNVFNKEEISYKIYFFLFYFDEHCIAISQMKPLLLLRLLDQLVKLSCVLFLCHQKIIIAMKVRKYLEQTYNVTCKDFYKKYIFQINYQSTINCLASSVVFRQVSHEQLRWKESVVCITHDTVQCSTVQYSLHLSSSKPRTSLLISGGFFCCS